MPWALLPGAHGCAHVCSLPDSHSRTSFTVVFALYSGPSHHLLSCIMEKKDLGPKPALIATAPPMVMATSRALKTGWRQSCHSRGRQVKIYLLAGGAGREMGIIIIATILALLGDDVCVVGVGVVYGKDCKD